MKDLVKEVSNIAGSWIENLIFDNKEIWNINKNPPTRPIATKNPIPSDSRYREDLIWLKYGNLDLSEYWKFELEKRQRDDKKLRQTYK